MARQASKSRKDRYVPVLALGKSARPKATADARFRAEVPQLRRHGLQLAPEMGEMNAEVVRLVAVLGSPHLLQQLPRRHQLPLVPDQHLDEVPLDRRQPGLPRRSGHPLGGQIDSEVG